MKPKSSAAEDLTIVILRGNGSPRSFRLPLPQLHRALTIVSFSFAFMLLAVLVLGGLSLVRGGRSSAPEATAPLSAPAPSAATETVAGKPAEAETEKSGSSGLWQKLSGSSGSATADPELQKEVQGLRDEIARLSATADGRKEIPASGTQPLLQFFGPRSVLVPESESTMRIRNPKRVAEAVGGQMALDFELHNVDPQQRQRQGYIVVLAKTPESLLAYPPGVLAPNQNIVLDFTRGETFAVSRFRQARATFPSAPLEGKRASFQVLLFGADGKVLANLHVEDPR